MYQTSSRCRNYYDFASQIKERKSRNAFSNFSNDNEQIPICANQFFQFAFSTFNFYYDLFLSCCLQAHSARGEYNYYFGPSCHFSAPVALTTFLLSYLSTYFIFFIKPRSEQPGKPLHGSRLSSSKVISNTIGVYVLPAFRQKISSLRCLDCGTLLNPQTGIQPCCLTVEVGRVPTPTYFWYHFR